MQMNANNSTPQASTIYLWPDVEDATNRGYKMLTVFLSVLQGKSSLLVQTSFISIMKRFCSIVLHRGTLVNA